ncbi:MAG: protein kinase [Planctomycetes bacterium]|nr:protein kinase [Planctomycetota bacterium]
MTPTLPDRPMPEQLGEYRLLRQIGSGGMGVVWEAEQRNPRRRVALKIVRPELLFFPNARERFQREVDVIARLQHPSIVPILGAAQAQGVPFFAMQLLDGLPLDQVTARLATVPTRTIDGRTIATAIGIPTDAPLPEALVGAHWQATLRLCLQLAEAMAHAHRRGVLHRDLKPANIMVTPVGRAVVLDFGLAREAGSLSITRTGGGLGSPAWMSPEQLRGEPCDERTDIWSLGAVAWQLLTLQAPFGTSDSQQVRDHILAGALPRLRPAGSRPPRAVETVLRHALELRREDRYRDMQSFADDLGRALVGGPIAARTPGPFGVVRRLLRRHRTLARGLLVVGALLAAMPAALWLQQSALARDLTERHRHTGRCQQLAHDAITALLMRPDWDGLADRRRVDLLRARMLQTAFDINDLLVRTGPTGLAVAQRIEAGWELAMTQDRLGDTARGIATIERVLELLPDDLLTNAGLQRRRADAHWLRASFAVATADPDTADRHLDLAVTWLQPLFADPAEATVARCSLLDVYETRARTAWRRGDRSARLQWMQQSRSLGQGLPAAERPPRALFQHVVTCNNLADLLADDGDVDEAGRLVHEAIAVLDAAPPDGCSRWEATRLRAYAERNAAKLAARANDVATFERHTRRSLWFAERNLREFPTVAEHAAAVARAGADLAEAMRVSQRLAEAIPLLQRAIALAHGAWLRSHDPELATLLETWHFRLGSWLDRAGRWRELASHALAHGRVPGKQSAARAAYAMCRALANLPEEHPETTVRWRRQAIALLQLAGERGFLPPLRDPVFAPIAAEPEFAGLLTEPAEQRPR